MMKPRHASLFLSTCAFLCVPPQSALGFECDIAARYPVAVTMVTSPDGNGAIMSAFGIGLDVRYWFQPTYFIEGVYDANLGLASRSVLFSGSHLGFGASVIGFHWLKEGFPGGEMSLRGNPVINFSAGLSSKNYNFSNYFPAGYTASSMPIAGTFSGVYFASEMSQSIGTLTEVSLGLSVERSLVSPALVSFTMAAAYLRAALRL